MRIPPPGAEGSCVIGTGSSPETMADCLWGAERDLVLAGRLSVNTLNILCKERAHALFQPDFQVSFIKTISLITTCNCLRSLHKTETKNTLESLREKPRRERMPQRVKGRRPLLNSLEQNAPALRLFSLYPIRKIPFFLIPLAGLIGLKTAIVGNLHGSNHPR